MLLSIQQKMLPNEQNKKLKTQKELCKADFENEKCALLKLPDVVLVMIFQNLDSLSLACASKVCRRWYNISQDNTLTSAFDLRMYPVTLNQLWKISRRKLTKSTTSVHVRGILSKNKEMERLTQPYLKDLFLKRCNGINNLSFEYFDLQNIPLNSIVEHVSRDLISLSLSGSLLPFKWFEGLKHEIRFPRLKVLNLDTCSKVSNADLESISYVNSLEKLILCNCHRISARGIPSIAKNLTNLKYLDFSGCTGINDVALFHLSNLSLNHLLVKFCHLISDYGVGLLFKESSRIHFTLKELDLYSCHELTDKFLDNLLENNSKTLMKLDIGGCDKLSKEKIDHFKDEWSHCVVKNVNIVSDCTANEIDCQPCTRIQNK